VATRERRSAECDCASRGAGNARWALGGGKFLAGTPDHAFIILRFQPSKMLRLGVLAATLASAAATWSVRRVRETGVRARARGGRGRFRVFGGAFHCGASPRVARARALPNRRARNLILKPAPCARRARAIKSARGARCSPRSRRGGPNRAVGAEMCRKSRRRRAATRCRSLSHARSSIKRSINCVSCGDGARERRGAACLRALRAPAPTRRRCSRALAELQRRGAAGARFRPTWLSKHTRVVRIS
jgi:hypothetical protein